LSSLVRSLRLKAALAAIATLILSGALLTACVGPATPARHALQQWLTDVSAHSVAYAYTLLSNSAETRTNYDAFFDGVNRSDATFKVVSLKVINPQDVWAVIAVKAPGATHATSVKLQVVEEGNGGDWLIGAPFSTEGARAILAFR
jgi:ABC-type oligopeptide transport system substrate-binding subunit